VAAALLGRKYVGIDQSAEYVRFAQSRLDHALQTSAPDAANRASRVLTATDAFGRPRVERKRAGRSVKAVSKAS
jgi:DNA modification methylase